MIEGCGGIARQGRQWWIGIEKANPWFGRLDVIPFFVKPSVGVVGIPAGIPNVKFDVFHFFESVAIEQADSPFIVP